MQYLIDDVKSKTEFRILGELPKKNIDTGMGMERVAFIKQGVENMYEIDQVRPVLDKVVELSGRTYGAVHEDDVRMRIIADHVRSSLMLMSDGVTPSNEGRGYILRRLMRRSVRAIRLLGVEEPTFAELFPASRDAMKAARTPRSPQSSSASSASPCAEEDSFLRTLANGTTILGCGRSRRRRSPAPDSCRATPPLLLHDTFGFPIDLTLEIAEEQGLTIDRDAFDAPAAGGSAPPRRPMRRPKKQQLADLSVLRRFPRQGRDGVHRLRRAGDAEHRARHHRGRRHRWIARRPGQIAEVILAETSLYAESGGQEADAGQDRRRRLRPRGARRAAPGQGADQPHGAGVLG